MDQPTTPPQQGIHLPSLPLAILPNGEAVRPRDVRRVLIEPAAAPVALEGRRFKVVVVLEAEERRVIGTGISRDDATELARRCGRAVNEALGHKT